LTRFTTLEEAQTREVILRAPAVSSDDTDFSRMPIMFGIAMLIWIVMLITMVIDQVFAVKDQKIKEDEEFDPVVSASPSPVRPGDEHQLETARRTHRNNLRSDRELL
jgi:hypothetical protein